MVLLHFKLGEKNQFIIETTSNTAITDIIKKGVEVNNSGCALNSGLCIIFFISSIFACANVYGN